MEEQCKSRAGCEVQESRKDKTRKDEKKQAASTKKLQQKFEEETKNDEGPMHQLFDKEVIIRLMERSEAGRTMIESMSEGAKLRWKKR